MANIKMYNMEDYLLRLGRLGEQSDRVAKKAVGAAAVVVADAVRPAIAALPTQEGMAANGKEIDVLSEAQKRGLIDGFGITPAKQDGDGVNIAVGFDGYNTCKTKKYPKGQPNQLIARSVESGSSVRKKHPFVRPAVRRVKKTAVDAMREVIDAETAKAIK